MNTVWTIAGTLKYLHPNSIYYVHYKYIHIVCMCVFVCVRERDTYATEFMNKKITERLSYKIHLEIIIRTAATHGPKSHGLPTYNTTYNIRIV